MVAALFSCLVMLSSIQQAEERSAVSATASPPTASSRLRIPEDLFGTVVGGDVRTPQTPAASSFRKGSFLKVLQYSVQLIGYEHVMRIAVQPFTRAELDGPFWEDYRRSVKMPKQWGDKDSWEVNILGHALHGSSGLQIWRMQREKNPFASRKTYFASLGRGFLYSILFSELFEISPISEAAIGNVGLREGRTGWSDHVMTPLTGILWTMYEDAVDRYVLTWLEKRVPFAMVKAAARMIASPAYMLANVGQNRLPWDRRDRPMTFGR